MPLSVGSRLGAYDIVSPLGAGGMGEVYRARDTKLGREVAVKVLPEAFAFDPERVARFEREAKVLASLNHPHIAALYGMEQAEGQHFLIMELVEGETLAERLQRGALKVEDALALAIQIADAVEAAHEKGVVHRDLKPANIKITPGDQVKVLDFGLARALEPAGSALPAGATAVTHSPTLSLMATQAGMILGTAAYMSPEQAKGVPADHRSDVFAFGCVLYEMLTGRQAFQGESAPDILASVLARDPEFAALPADLHPRLVEILRRCLDKAPRRRWQAIGDLRMELETIAASPHKKSSLTVALPGGSQWWRIAVIAVSALVLGGVISGGTVWLTTRPVPPSVTRLNVALPGAAALSINGVDRDLAITPDGSRLVYIASNGTQLLMRALDALDPVTVFKGSVRAPAVSPDGEWVAFADNTTVKRVAITGGPAVNVTNIDATPRGVTWTSNETIVFATTGPAGLQSVTGVGGMPVALTQPDRAQGEIDHYWPEALPDDRGVLFTVTAAGGLDAAQVAVLDSRTKTYKILIRGGSHAHYVRSGHLVYGSSGTLRAVAFDLESLEIRGTPVPVVSDVLTTGIGSVDAVVAQNGTLAYVSGAAGGPQRSLAWVDRSGKEIPIPVPPRAYVYPRLSPDGVRTIVWSFDEGSDLWLWDPGRTTLTRVTFDPALDSHHVWTPDGRRVVFSSERAGARNIYWQAADGTGTVERLTESPNQQNATAITPDGARVIFSETTLKTGADLMQVELGGAHSVTPLLQTPFIEQNGTVSPDGRWLAYEATDSGQYEVYVRPYPDVNSGIWQVSTGGGTRPLWARNGRELFYVSSSAAIMGIGIENGASWTATIPSMVVKEGYFASPGGNPGRTYDISPDGQRFLMIKPSASDQARGVNSLVVVQNWTEELKARVPVR